MCQVNFDEIITIGMPTILLPQCLNVFRLANDFAFRRDELRRDAERIIGRQFQRNVRLSPFQLYRSLAVSAAYGYASPFLRTAVRT